MTYARVEDYWGRDLPVNRGRANFDVVRYDVFRDRTIARLRLLDNVAAVKFKRERSFDMYFRGHDLVNPPMSQLHTYFGFANADRAIGGNLSGIRDPLVDALIEFAQQAGDMESAAVACRALDRVLLWGFYHVPLNSPDVERFLYWDRFGRPDESGAVYDFLAGGLSRVIDSWCASPDVPGAGGDAAYPAMSDEDAGVGNVHSIVTGPQRYA